MIHRLIMILLIGASDIAVAQAPFDQILHTANEKWDANLLKPGLGLA
ncbi:MAG TPA: hypothetical protein VFO10_05910 [Oligoflexus sp.]|nr:hypothetical protein [Oligoflexus sp.]HET9236763.1 hypothetical protein [Oligoflexus sp.]